MKPLDLEIGLADSQLERYSKAHGALEVVVRAWNERTITFTFRDAVFVREKCAGDLADVYVIDDAEDEALKIGLACAFETLPPVHGYQLYAFTNPDDERALEVVAAGISVSYA